MVSVYAFLNVDLEDLSDPKHHI